MLKNNLIKSPLFASAGKIRFLPWHGIIVFAIIFVLRIPFIFPWVLDGDESTFILLGRDMLQGRWPLVNAWDNKFPPFIFVQGVALLFAGGTIEGMRILATLVLFALVYLVRLLSKNLGLSKNAAWLAGFLTALAICDNPSSAHLGTELVGAPFLIAALVLLTRPNFGVQVGFWAGVLLALAVFMRPNFAYAVLGICLVLTLFQFSEAKRRYLPLLFIMIGGATVILAVFGPYAVMGKADDLWQENVILSLAYNSNFVSDQGLIEILKRFWFDNNILFILMFLGGLGALRKLVGGFDLSFIIVMTAFVATMYSVFVGPTASHYLIMLAPFVGVFSAIAFSVLSRSSQPLRYGAALMIVALSFFTLKDVQTRAQLGIDHNYAERIFEVLDAHREPSDTYFLLAWQIHYHTFDVDTPHRLVHPFNITMPLYVDHFEPTAGSPAGMLDLMLEEEFDWVVARPERIMFQIKSSTGKEPPEWRTLGDVFQEHMANNYILFHQGDEGSIYLHKRHASRVELAQ